MAALTFTDFKNMLALRLGNMQSSDPFYTYLGPWVNRGLNGTVMRALSKSRRKANLFPELRDKWYTLTTANTGYVAKPTDCLVVTDLFSFDSSAAPAMETDTRYQMSEMTSAKKWEILDHTATAEYPRLWFKYGNHIQIHPVPTSANTTYLLILGLAQENDLSAGSDTPVLDQKWHEAVVDFSAYLAFKDMGWYDDAQKALEAADVQLQQTIDITGLENSSGEAFVEVAGDPTR